MHIDALRHMARRAADLHGIDYALELDRLARGNGRPTWASLLEALPDRNRDDLESHDDWNLSVEDRREDLADVRFVPRYDPLQPDRLPAPDAEREDYVERIARILLDQALDTVTPTRMGEKTLGGMVTVIHDAIGAAEGEGRPARITQCLNIIGAIVAEAHAARLRVPNDNGDPLAEALLARDDLEHHPAIGTLGYRRLAEHGVGTRSGILGGIEQSLVIFRNVEVVRLLR